MSISGNLKTMPFPDLLQWVSQSRKTGTLAIDGPRFKKKLYFREGRVVASASDNPREYLGYYLVGWEILGEDELQELLQMQDRHGALMGELLVIIGRLPRAELADLLQVKTEASIFDLFLWPEGEFRFLEGILPTKKFYPLDIDVEHLILEGVRRVDERERSRAVVGEDDWIPTLSTALDVKNLTPLQRDFLCEVNGKNSIESIALVCRVDSFLVREFVVEGVGAGVLTVRPPEGGSKAIPGYSKMGWRTPVQLAEKAVTAGRLTEAYQLLAELEEKIDGNRKAQETVDVVRTRIEDRIVESGCGDEAVLELAVPVETLTELSCSREEGFLLSRINGVYSVGQILKQLPGAALAHRVAMHSLVGQGILRSKGP